MSKDKVAHMRSNGSPVNVFHVSPVNVFHGSPVNVFHGSLINVCHATQDL